MLLIEAFKTLHSRFQSVETDVSALRAENARLNRDVEDLKARMVVLEKALNERRIRERARPK